MSRAKLTKAVKDHVWSATTPRKRSFFSSHLSRLYPALPSPPVLLVFLVWLPPFTLPLAFPAPHRPPVLGWCQSELSLRGSGPSSGYLCFPPAQPWSLVPATSAPWVPNQCAMKKEKKKISWLPSGNEAAFFYLDRQLTENNSRYHIQLMKVIWESQLTV